MIGFLKRKQEICIDFGFREVGAYKTMRMATEYILSLDL
jgi:hypothetical protein